jgi:hypothetical protein
MQKKLIITSSLLLLNAALLHSQVYGQGLGDITPPPATTVTINFIIETFVDFVLGAGIVVFLLYFMWGSLEWLTSAGDKGRLQMARDKITNALIGLIILATVFGVMEIVKAITYDPEISSPGTPGTPPLNPGGAGGPGSIDCISNPGHPSCITPD